MTILRNNRRYRGAPAAIAGLTIAIGTLAASTVLAQGLSGRPGVEYYPSWMMDTDPRVSGGGQDYRIWDDKRFDRRDEQFLEFQRQQRQDLGPGYTNRPEYEDGLRRFDEDRADRNAVGPTRP